MKHLFLITVLIVGMVVTAYAGETGRASIPQDFTEYAGQTNNASATVVSQGEHTQTFNADAAVKKRRKKKKSKLKPWQYVVAGVVIAGAVVIYVLTDGEGYHSR